MKNLHVVKEVSLVPSWFLGSECLSVKQEFKGFDCETLLIVRGLRGRLSLPKLHKNQRTRGGLGGSFQSVKGRTTRIVSGDIKE